jgi:Tol biopolymer transport system component
MSQVPMSVILVCALTALIPQAQPQAARYYNPRFSPDASRVIFESSREGKMSVYSINVDGTGLRKLTDGKQDDAQPQWSVDTKLITYTSITEGLNKIFVMNGDGSGRRQISSGPKNDAAPSFSTDGRHVAWAATTVLPEDWRDIGVAASDGSGTQRLVTSGLGNDQAPVWISPTRIVFIREFPPKTDWRAMSPEDHARRRATSEVWAVNADGSGLQQLTKNDVYDSDPSWVAALKRVFFASTRSGAPELFSMNADGSDERRVADFTGSVSPDGRLVTYSRITDGRSAIYVRPIAGGAERELIGG